MNYENCLFEVGFSNGNTIHTIIEHEDDIEPYVNVIDWHQVFDTFALSDDFMLRNIHSIPWRMALEKVLVSPLVIEALVQHFALPENAVLLEEEAIELESRYYEFWSLISTYQPLPESFIETYINELDMVKIVYNRMLSDAFIERNFDKLKNYGVLTHQVISEQLILEKIDSLNKDELHELFMYQELRESFIDKLPVDKVDWQAVSKYQDFTFSFLLKHSEQLARYGKNRSVVAAIRMRMVLNRFEPIFDDRVIYMIERFAPIVREEN